MAIDYNALGPQSIKKPEPRQRTKRRGERHERKTRSEVRAECVDRDGYCRVAEMMRTPCHGRSEWAHLEDKRRCFTRGMEPGERHSTKWTMQMCDHHHGLYDAHAFDVRFVDEDRGADGPIEVVHR